MKTENVVIIGSGPAGYTAALYTARANLQPVVIEGFMWGGLLQQTTDVENFPGFPGGVQGPALMTQMRDQAERFGARMITDQATDLVAGADGQPHTVIVGDQAIHARAVIVATGADHKKLGVPGEAEYSGRGVSYCATCDAAFFKDQQIVVVGGGDSAMEEAMFLAKFAEQVTVVHRRHDFRASRVMLERARATENIGWMTGFKVEELLGENGRLTAAQLWDIDNAQAVTVPCQGAFVAIGHQPQSELVAGLLDCDDEGYVITDGKTSVTNVPGIFACGDLADRSYRQAITAAGSGCVAAIDCERYLRDM